MPEFADILGTTPYALRRGGISLRLRAEDPQTVAKECGTSLKMLSAHYAFAIDDLRRFGPRSVDVEWRAARAARAELQTQERARHRRKLFAWFAARGRASRVPVADALKGLARKGRILAVWQGETLVAACAWHLHDTGPPVIFDLGARPDLPARQQRRACMALLACLRDIAQALGRSTDELRWSDRPLDRVPGLRQRNRYRALVRARASAMQFVPLRPRPKFWRGRWAAKRSF
jgi:hypothetical protein